MKKALLAIFFFITLGSKAQPSGYCGLTFDSNTKSTRALGIHGEWTIDDENWYVNWDFAIGANISNEFYGRTNVFLLCYKNPGYWQAAAGSSRPIAGIVAGLVLPWICPVGVTHYFINSPDYDFRVGWYLNPLGLEYWKSQNRINAWSVNGGLKFIYGTEDGEMNFYARIGLMSTVNSLSYPGASRENGLFFNVSLGVMGGIW